MKPWSRVPEAEYRELELRAHTLLADVPLHDVWRVELPGGGPDVTLEDVRGLLSLEEFAKINPVVRGLFSLRGQMGRWFGWDAERRPPRAAPREGSYLHRLTDADRAASRVAPGSMDGAFQVLYVHAFEAVNEIRNATVHAFSVLALQTGTGGQRLYWAIHVAPVGRITAFYMALIDPFRRWIIYPAILGHVHRRWCERDNR